MTHISVRILSSVGLVAMYMPTAPLLRSSTNSVVQSTRLRSWVQSPAGLQFCFWKFRYSLCVFLFPHLGEIAILEVAISK